ncbi:MAG: ATP-binding protein, partial [Calditrichia bacterium]
IFLIICVLQVSFNDHAKSLENMPKETFKRIYQRIKDDAGDDTTLESLNRQRLTALYRVSRELNSILNPDELFPKVLNQIQELLHAEHIIIISKEGDDLNIRTAANPDDQSRLNALKFSRQVVSQVMDNYQPVFSRNALEDERFSQFDTVQQLEILSMICVPIVMDNQVLGTIYVDNRQVANIFREDDVDFLQAFANLLGIAIRNSQAYRQVEELNRSLESKVARRTAQLQNTLDELKTTQSRLVQSEKMAGIGRLIAGFLHEFNNPINFIYSNLPHLEDYSHKMLAGINQVLLEIPEERKREIEAEYDLEFLRKDLLKLVDAVRAGTERSRQIVNDLKSFAGSGASQMQIVDWQQNLLKIIEVFRRRQSTPPQVECRGKEGIEIQAVQFELNQAIFNLLQNAADAGASRIEIRSRTDGKYLYCDIKDNGSGIAENQLSKIFDPFFTTKNIGQGMGLGLSMVYGAVSRLNGGVEVDSVLGKGTTFHLKFPLAE